MSAVTQNKLNVAIDPTEPEVVMTRLFNAPRQLVWKAMTEREHVAKWWGLRGSTNVVTDWDVRPGGKWRIEQHNSDGSVNAFRGVYLDVAEPERLVNTFTMEGIYEDKTVTETHQLEEVDGKTRVTNVSRFENLEDRDGMVASGMEYGAAESWDQLEELLASLGA